jgi:Holliday junction resolvase RusA-like endonuclease
MENKVISTEYVNKKYSFEIPDRAIGKQRPRYSSITHRMYTPIATRSFEDKVKWAFTSKYNIATELSTKPFKAKITAIFKPAESLSKKKKEELLYKIDYTKKPDADNIAKSILDSLNGLAYKDDSQVSALLVLKDYGEENKIIVELEEI